MYRNNSRVFIFGAGVSRAVAGAPVMKELFSRMEERYRCEKKRSDLPEGNNRVLWFKELQGFIEKLENQAKRRFNQIKENENVQIKSEIRENIEYLITLLDIHTEYSAMFKFKQLGVDWDPYPFIPLDYTSRDEMKKIRNHLAIYLFLCLSNLEDEDGVLEKFFRERLRPDDHLITFNYDLLIEKTLWKIGQWSPVKGYVGVEQLEYKKDEEELIEAGWDRSPHKILKLHGSINWKYKDALSTNVKEDPVVTLDNLEKWDFFFPEKLRKILKREPAQPTGIEERLISKGYAGSYSPLPWILPSYVKVFSKASFFINIWKKTQRILAETKRLVVLGYSFPEVDSQSQLLLASLPDDCSILIVDPDADAIKIRMDKLFQFPDISVQKMEFEKWVQQGCPGLK